MSTRIIAQQDNLKLREVTINHNTYYVVILVTASKDEVTLYHSDFMHDAMRQYVNELDKRKMGVR